MYWEKIEQKGELPLSRSSHSVTVIKNKAYVFGGENQPRTPIDSRLHCLDLETKQWNVVQARGEAPSPRVGHTAVAVGNSVYIFGGRTAKEVGEGSLNDIYRFDTDSSTWSCPEATCAPPPKRSFHAMASDGKKHIYVFGGCGEAGRLNDLFCFDTESKRWEQHPASDTIKARGGAGLVTTNSDGLFVVAGFCGQEMKDWHRYDLHQRQWDCPACCQRCQDCQGQEMLLLYGGEIDPSTQGHDGAGGFSSEVFSFTENARGNWIKEKVTGTPPKPRGWFASCASGMNLLIHGGNSDTNERLDDMYILHVH